MVRTLLLAALAVVVLAAPAQAGVTGQYVEVRNCDVWTGPCFANAEGNLIGKHAALVWHVDKGTLDNVRLDGLTVIVMVQATDTLGFKQSGEAKAVVLVDGRATEAQKLALVRLADAQGGELVKNIARVESVSMKVNMCGCDGEACAEIDASVVKIKTRCLDAKHDKACGNEIAYFPPLTSGVRAVPAVAEHSYNGSGLSMTWHEVDRRGAYVGTFTHP